MTVADVARSAHVTERTVRRDIAARRLPAHRRKNGRLHILERDLRQYRSIHALRQPLMKIKVTVMIGMSLRYVRRLVALGRIKTGARQPAGGCSFPNQSTVGCLVRAFTKWRPPIRRTRSPSGSVTGQTPAARLWLSIPISVAEMARRAHRQVRQIHHDIRKGVIPPSAI